MLCMSLRLFLYSSNVNGLAGQYVAGWLLWQSCRFGLSSCSLVLEQNFMRNSRLGTVFISSQSYDTALELTVILILILTPEESVVSSY